MTLPPPDPWAPPTWAPPSRHPLPPPPPPGWVPTGLPPAPPKRPNWLPLVAILIVCGFLWVVINPLGGTRQAAAPKAWDPRVTQLATFVENERGLKFKHPVPFEFMTEEQFVAAIIGIRPKADPDRDKVHEAVLRARGYVGPDYNSVKAEEDFVSNVTGYYDNADKKMRVRGTELTPYAKVTIVHELTHALQDQQFSIKKVRNGIESDEQDFAIRSLIEGDARDIENAYIHSLSETEQRAVYDAENPAGSNALDNTPEALQVQFGAPYELGALMVGTLRHIGGVDGLNDAFRNPPSDEAAVVLPFVPETHSNVPLAQFGKRCRGEGTAASGPLRLPVGRHTVDVPHALKPTRPDRRVAGRERVGRRNHPCRSTKRPDLRRHPSWRQDHRRHGAAQPRLPGVGPARLTDQGHCRE